VWDLDDFTVTQIGDFYESAAITAFASATWQYFGETNSPSLNDFIKTTLGVIAFGECSTATHGSCEPPMRPDARGCGARSRRRSIQ